MASESSSVWRHFDRSRASSTTAAVVVSLGCMLLAVDGEDSKLRLLGLPGNTRVDPALNDVVAHLLRASPTFRAQCRRIGQVRSLRISVELAVDPPAPSRRPGRAHCVMARYEFGGIDALVQLWSLDEAAELIAHEFEHVLEYADRINYRALALTQPGNVWLARGGHFETRRAIEAGQQVSRESRD